MASLFDEPILRAPLRAMTEDEREQYVNGFIDHKQRNRNLYAALISLADAITFACSHQMTQQETLGMQAYLAKLGQG